MNPQALLHILTYLQTDTLTEIATKILLDHLASVTCNKPARSQLSPSFIVAFITHPTATVGCVIQYSNTSTVLNCVTFYPT